mmetsp:Transcript_11341/g.28553  ORF Transcript_11341/g.28553 Transcript_11341/m.28553 type:complete len:426 (-) Transcript_11341:261-1538(-)
MPCDEGTRGLREKTHEQTSPNLVSGFSPWPTCWTVEMTASIVTAKVETDMNATNMKTRIEFRPVFETNQPTALLPQSEPTKVPDVSNNVGTTGIAPPKTKLIVALLLTIVIMTVTVAVATNGSMPAPSSMGFSTIPPPMPTTELKAPTPKQVREPTSERRTENPVASKKTKAIAVMHQYSQEHICTPTAETDPFPPRRTKLTTRIAQTTNNINHAFSNDPSLQPPHDADGADWPALPTSDVDPATTWGGIAVATATSTPGVARCRRPEEEHDKGKVAIWSGCGNMEKAECGVSSGSMSPALCPPLQVATAMLVWAMVPSPSPLVLAPMTSAFCTEPCSSAAEEAAAAADRFSMVSCFHIAMAFESVLRIDTRSTKSSSTWMMALGKAWFSKAPTKVPARHGGIAANASSGSMSRRPGCRRCQAKL